MSTNDNVKLAAVAAAEAATKRLAVKATRKASRHACEMQYAVVEAATEFVETGLGDAPEVKYLPKGSTKLANGCTRIKPVDSQVKGCLANFTKLAAATTIISVPTVALDGTVLTEDERAMALYLALRKDGKRLVPIATMSSLKDGTVYGIEEQAFNEWVSHYNLAKDGRKFATYAGLVFSDIAAAPIGYDITVEVSGNGRDGNSPANRACFPEEWWLGYNGGQFRAAEIVDGYPLSIAKGTFNLFKKGPGLPILDNNQVKMTTGKVAGHTGTFMIAPCDTTARMTKVWMSAEPILSLRDEPAVRQFLAAKTNVVVSDMLSLLTEEHRAELSERLGGLQLTAEGNLEPELRAVLDLLNSNVPWCAEIETRITRFLINLITEQVIPSAGIECFQSLLVMSDEHGAKMLHHPGKDASVEEIDAFMKTVKCLAFRIPHMGAENTVYLDRDPFVRGLGMVVTSEVAAAVDGDADGDGLRTCYDREVIALFAHYTNWETVGSYKPEKRRIECALTADMLEDFVLQQWNEAWMVGGLTIAAWKMWQCGEYARGTRLASLAKFAPMTMKHDILLNGKRFADVVSHEYGAVREALKEIHLYWHEMVESAKVWKSPRELAKAQIDGVQSVLDSCWNAGVKAAQDWANANPLLPLSMTAVKHLVFEAGNRPSSQDWYEARSMINEWGAYWKPIMEAGGPKPGQKHAIYDTARNWARNASQGALAAMLMYMPKNQDNGNDGFGVKFHTVFAAGRGTEVLGLHPQIAEFLKAKRNWAQDALRQIALVDAMIETIK